MGTRPWEGRSYVRSGPDYPASYLSWEDVQEFIRRLNRAEGANVYRLPTEAEWEYACRAGTTTRWSFGDDESQLTHYAWYVANTFGAGEAYGHRVGMKRANPWGLYDIHGNMMEWVQDPYQADYYSVSPSVDPTGPATGTHRVARGGAIGNRARGVRSVDRGGNMQNFRDYYTGFRLLRQVDAFSTDVPPKKIYWTNGENILRANLDGSQIEDVVTDAGGPDGIALDASGGKVYWTDRRGLKIRRANLDGSQIEDIVTTGLKTPIEIAVDVSAGKMYWIDFGTGKVQRANLDGSQIEDIITGVLYTHALALDVSGGKVYWGGMTKGEIRRANLDGSQVEYLIAGLSGIHGLALDVSAGKMYWVSQNAGAIYRANLDGSQTETLVTGLTKIRAVALDVSAGKMYWTNEGSNKIQRANLDGSQIEDAITGIGGPRGIALDLAGSTDSSGGGISPDLVDPENADVLSSVIILPDNTQTFQGNPPSPTNSATAPTISSGVSRLTSSNGSTVQIPFSYNTLANISGCYLYINGARDYFYLPYTAQSSTSGTLSIPIGIPTNVTAGQFCTIICIIDSRGEISNIIETCVDVLELGSGVLQISLAWDNTAD